jgi:Zn-dependent peptidase ImmA (M78 family)
MKRPKSVTILGRKFTVKEVEQKEVEKHIGPGAVAGINYTERLILISKGFDDFDYRVSIMHEVTHAVLHTIGLDQTISDHIREILCESMANGFNDLYLSMKK